ncbi:hypothetical protein ACA910_022095 [Epithemia clementina (nom. ined.)]
MMEPEITGEETTTVTPSFVSSFGSIDETSSKKKSPTRSKPKRKQSTTSSASSWSDVLVAELGGGNHQNNDDNIHNNIHSNNNHPIIASSESSLSSSCDRRLSRAARFSMKSLILDFLQFYDSRHKNKNNNNNNNKKYRNNKNNKKDDRNNNQDKLTALLQNKDSVTDQDLLQFLLPPPPPSRPSSSSPSSSPPTPPSVVVCPLYPDYDVFQSEVQHTQLLNARIARNQWTHGNQRSTISSLMIHLPLRGYSYNPYLYQCLYCQKVFTTQYYLDQHMMSKHHRHHNHQTNDTEFMVVVDGQAPELPLPQQPLICPAVTWCQFLPNCHETALTLEPYYGRGSEGRREGDRTRVATQLWKQAHQVPCTRAKMVQAQQACHDMLQTCFPLSSSSSAGHDDDNDDDNDDNDETRVLQRAFVDYWQSHVCDQQLSCPNRLHRLFFAAQEGGHAAVRHVHDWQEEWDQWTHQSALLQHLNVAALVLTVTLCLAYACICGCCWQDDDDHHHHHFRYNGWCARFWPRRKKGSTNTTTTTTTTRLLNHRASTTATTPKRKSRAATNSSSTAGGQRTKTNAFSSSFWFGTTAQKSKQH